MSVNRTRIKICGITRRVDASTVVSMGADALGLVFWEPSSRAVSIEQAVDICAAIPPFVSVVALTVNADKSFIESILQRLPITVLQFHGDESPEFCEQFSVPYIKAIRMKPGIDLNAEIERYRSAQGILLDAYREGMPGGTGEKFDWNVIPKVHRERIILAGGLNASNVTEAVRHIAPFAVDVSGGVESSVGIKDPEKIKQFITAVTLGDQTEQS